MLVQFAFATLCAYFARFAVPLLFYRKVREETAKERKEMRVKSGKLNQHDQQPWQPETAELPE